MRLIVSKDYCLLSIQSVPHSQGDTLNRGVIYSGQSQSSYCWIFSDNS